MTPSPRLRSSFNFKAQQRRHTVGSRPQRDSEHTRPSATFPPYRRRPLTQTGEMLSRPLATAATALCDFACLRSSDLYSVKLKIAFEEFSLDALNHLPRLIAKIQETKLVYMDRFNSIFK
uniref:Uncharacterized protein n=1 Tax=Opuntia streptacantha TaxID=393608 RepID=A0A7C9AB69_OPUST